MNRYNSNYLAILACLLWATAFAGIKIGLAYTSPLRFAGIRFMLAGLLIFPFVKQPFNELKIILQNWKQLLLISLFQTFGLYLFFYLGIFRVPAAATALIVGASPLVIAVLAHFAGLNEPLDKRKTMAILIGVLGIACIALSKNGNNGRGNISLVGIILLLLSSISGGMGNILITRFKLQGSPILKNSMQLFLGGLGLFFVSLFFEDRDFAIRPLPYYLSLAWLSFISAAAFSLWFVVLQRTQTKVSEINIWKFIIPVFGAILSWLVIPDESPTLFSLLGALFVGSALLLINYKALRRKLQMKA